MPDEESLSRDVDEARQRILDFTSDRWEVLSPRLDALVAAVRKQERGRFPRKQLEAARAHLLMPPRTYPSEQALDYVNIALRMWAAPVEGGEG